MEPATGEVILNVLAEPGCKQPMPHPVYFPLGTRLLQYSVRYWSGNETLNIKLPSLIPPVSRRGTLPRSTGDSLSRQRFSLKSFEENCSTRSFYVKMPRVAPEFAVLPWACRFDLPSIEMKTENTCPAPKAFNSFRLQPPAPNRIVSSKANWLVHLHKAFEV